MKEKEILYLGDIAYARSGDKGSNANIGVIAYNRDGYEFMSKYLTAEKVQNYFSRLNLSLTIRYELPNLLALNFVLLNALEGGASSSLRLDNQGKTLAQSLLLMPSEFLVLKQLRVRADSF